MRAGWPIRVQRSLISRQCGSISWWPCGAQASRSASGSRIRIRSPTSSSASSRRRANPSRSSMCGSAASDAGLAARCSRGRRSSPRAACGSTRLPAMRARNASMSAKASASPLAGSSRHGGWRTSNMNGNVRYSVHDDLPPEARLVDDGLGAANDQAAPLHEVRPLSCFARLESGRVIGGAVGRTWGRCGELQQLWVDSAHRRKGIGTRLVKEFEARAQARGCRIFYLETFNFQTPQLYRALGYEVRYEHTVYPYGIVKYIMV